MPPSKPRMARDELVTIISEFYAFLTKFYIPSSALKHPPPEGWPSITPETTNGFNKSPIVVDLIKHLPYIDETEAREMITNIHYKSDVVDWSVRKPEDFAGEGEGGQTGEDGLRYWIEERTKDRIEQEDGSEDTGAEDDDNKLDQKEDKDQDCDEDGDNEEKENSDDADNDSEEDEEWNCWDWDEGPESSDLPNMIALAQGYESGGRDIVLDVFKSVIYEDNIRCSMQDGVDVREFFEDLRQRYERLELVPIRGEMFEEGCYDAGEADEYKGLYRDYGWPGEAYRKEKALAAIEHCRQRREAEEYGECRQ